MHLPSSQNLHLTFFDSTHVSILGGWGVGNQTDVAEGKDISEAFLDFLGGPGGCHGLLDLKSWSLSRF